jgi:cell wall-associated NlpC family hydrolase
VSEPEARARVGAIAHTWLGTPFHDHARVKGAGCDCATFLLETFEEAGLIPHTDVGHYSPQFFMHSPEERYLGWVLKFGREIPVEQTKPGDIVLYKLGLCYAHGALIVEPGWPWIIHSHAAARRVIRAKGTSPHLGRVRGVKFFSLWAD